MKQTNALAAQITQRLRELAKRQGLLPPSSRAGSLDLVSLAAQTTQALARSLGPVGFDAYLKEHGKQLTNSLSMPVTRQRLEEQRTDVITVK